MQKAGAISGLEIQVRYELIPGQKYPGSQTERRVEYVADFVYHENGKTVVEDVKGVRTREYILKRKIFKYRYCREGGTVFRET